MGASIPPWRRIIPSSTVYTPSQRAPFARAVLATITDPCPYAFALSTAMTSLGATWSIKARTFAARASRFTSARVALPPQSVLDTRGRKREGSKWEEVCIPLLEQEDSDDVPVANKTHQLIVLDN